MGSSCNIALTLIDPCRRAHPCPAFATKPALSEGEEMEILTLPSRKANERRSVQHDRRYYAA
jgi:hypothetical protein